MCADSEKVVYLHSHLGKLFPRKGSRNISKFQKPDENIQNLNDDRYAYQYLGCTPIDLHVDNQINGDQVGKCEEMYLIFLLLLCEICSFTKNILLAYLIVAY